VRHLRYALLICPAYAHFMAPVYAHFLGGGGRAVLSFYPTLNWEVKRAHGTACVEITYYGTQSNLQALQFYRFLLEF
jgi:hypothetical protein